MKRIAKLGISSALLFSFICLSSAWVRSYFRYDEIQVFYIIVRGKICTFSRISGVSITSGTGAICLTVEYAQSDAPQSYRDAVQDIFPPYSFESRADWNDRPRGYCYNDGMPAIVRWLGIGGEISDSGPSLWPFKRYQIACPYWLLTAVALVLTLGACWNSYIYLIEIRNQLFKRRGFDIP